MLFRSLAVQTNPVFIDALLIGANHQTLYITGLGNGMGSTSMGIYRADMPLPGMPF